MDLVTVYDVLRMGTLIAGSMSLGVTGLVTVVYARRYLTHRRLHHAGRVDAWRGLLPRHVVGIGVSHILLILLTMVTTVRRVHYDPDSLYTVLWAPGCLIAYTVGLLALRDVLSHSRHRIADRSPVP